MDDRGSAGTTNHGSLGLATIGYEHANVASFLAELTGDGVEILVDVRAIASSRRPGFAKSRLTANLAEVGIDYIHLRDLGTPADGRAAARAGRHDEMRTIYLAHMQSAVAQDDLAALEELVRSGRRICLLCLEANPEHCHRSMVIDALADRLPIQVTHLKLGAS